MKRKPLTHAARLLCALALSMSLAPAALAADPSEPTQPSPCYPTAVTRSEDGTEIRKMYDLGPEDDPGGIPRSDFEQDGYHYTLTDLLKQELPANESRQHTETVSVNSKSKDMGAVLALLPQTKEFITEDGLSGVLTLKLDTVKVEVAGYGSSTKTVTATRTYPGLANQDTQYIPKTIQDGGNSMTLQTVNWQTEGDGHFTAMASYSGSATSSYVKGYTVTADYAGTVSRINLNKIRYVAIFEGTALADPEGEYAPLIEAMDGVGSVIRVAAGGKDRLNAMYMVDGYGENNPIVVKSQFIMSLVERIDPKGVGPQHNSIIDRCTGDLYEEAEQNDTVPTLAALREKLMEQPEAEAREIALALELFTTGSLDIFGHDSTVDLDKRVVVFDIHGLGEQLKPIGHLVITDTMLNRVTLNWKKGRRTHVFIDEFHVMFENEFSAAFFNSAWRQFRKRNAYPTAITQNVEYLLDSVQASTMLSNSEFIVMLNQAAGDREKLAHLLNISEEQMSYITNADAGCGLIKYGSALVPFANRFPHNTELYRLMTTRPGEGRFSGGRA